MDSDMWRVLVIDDSPDTGELLAPHLEALGYAALVALDGESGIEMAGRERPDAILLDIRLPGLDGLDVCRCLRRNRETADIPILLVTGMADVRTRITGFEAGADDFVTKPFEVKELAARLRAHVALALQRRRIATMEGVLGTVRALAHDFSNPLQAAIGGVHLALETGEGQARELGLRIAQDNLDRLFELTHQLRRVARPVFRSSPLGPILDMVASVDEVAPAPDPPAGQEAGPAGRNRPVEGE